MMIRKINLLLILGLFVLACQNENPPKKTSSSRAFLWPQFRGDSQLSGQSDEQLPDNLKLVWSFQTGDDIKSSPVLDYGRLYIGSTDGKLYALDAAGGDSLWVFDTGDDVEAPPMLLDSTVFIGSLSGEFFAIDAISGEQKWSYKTDDEIYGSASWIFAPDKKDKWIIVCSYDFNIYCFDAETGVKQWNYETDNYINGAPATDGKVVVFGGCDELLHIVSVDNGEKVGEVDAGSYIAGSAALVDDRAYLGHYGESLLCFDVEKKEIAWEYNNDGATSAFFSSPAVSKDKVVIGCRDKLVHCVNRKTGEKIWTFQTRNDVDSSPVIAGDKVVVGSNDGRLYVLNLEDGQLVWSYEIGADILGSPAVTGGFIFVGAEDGRVYAFGESL